MSDIYKRLIQPDATDARCVAVLRIATIVWGAIGTALSIVLVRVTESALDIWWLFSSVLGSAIIGLFLLGLIVHSLRKQRALLVFLVGLSIIAWMTFSAGDYWPEALRDISSPFHPLLVIVIGPSVMILLGILLAPKALGQRASEPDE